MQGAAQEHLPERTTMVDQQIRARGIRSPTVLEALRIVPRHVFVPPEYQDQAYADYPLPIGFGQTISQPYIVALMTELLQLSGSERVLEVGCGSGYQTAILCRLAHWVFAMEIQEELVQPARDRLSGLGVRNATLLAGDGSLGLAVEAPFDRILVAAAAPRVPEPLLTQLSPGGRLVIPVGDPFGQVLEIWQKDAQGHPSVTNHIGVVFVPLRGREGWPRT